MTVVVPDFNSIQSVLDVCKVCDSCVLLISATRDPEEYGDTLLSSLLGEFSNCLLLCLLRFWVCPVRKVSLRSYFSGESEPKILTSSCS